MLDALLAVLPAVLAGLLGAAVPMLGSVYFAFKAKAEADGVKDWKDYLVEAVDAVAEELDEDEDEKPAA